MKKAKMKKAKMKKAKMKKNNINLLFVFTPTIVITVITFICGGLANASFNISAWPDDIREKISIAYAIANIMGWVFSFMIYLAIIIMKDIESERGKKEIEIAGGEMDLNK
jgi:uncharacterized membrane protein